MQAERTDVLDPQTPTFFASEHQLLVKLARNVIDRALAGTEPASNLVADLADQPIHVEVL